MLIISQGGEGMEKLKGKTITAPAVLEKELWWMMSKWEAWNTAMSIWYRQKMTACANNKFSIKTNRNGNVYYLSLPVLTSYLVQVYLRAS